MKKRFFTGNRTWVLYCVALLAMGALFLWRCRYGFDWSDETYYTTLPYRFYLGDALFKDMWELHQLSAILFYPFTWIYLTVTGGDTTGIMLFFRVAFVAVQTLCSIGIFLLLKRRYPPAAAFIAAALCLGFVHFGLSNFSYDSMSLLLLLCAFALTARDADGIRGRIYGALSGALYALSVQCYPQLAATLPLWAVYFILRARRGKRPSKDDGSGRFSGLLWFALGVGAVAAAFIGFVMANSSFAALRENLQYILAEPSHPGQNTFASLKSYAGTLLAIFGPLSVALLLLTGGSIVLSYLKPTPKTGTAKAVLLCLLSVVLALCVVRVALYDIEASVKINFLAVPAGLCYPALYFLNGRKRDASMLLFLFGLGFSLAVQLSSNMGVYASSFPLLCCSVATALYMSRRGEGPACPARRGLAAAALCVVLLGVTCYRVVGVHRDAPLQEQTSVMETGPAKGIRSTPQNVETYEALMKAVREYAPGQNSVMTTSMFPFLYLCTDLTPAAPSVWYTPYDSRLKAYYEMRPDRIPSLIVTLPYGVGSSVGDGDAALLMEQLYADYGAEYREDSLGIICFYTRIR